MFKNLKWLRLVPDKPGKGGQKSGFHTFQAQPVNETRVTYAMHVYRGRWRKDFASNVPSSVSATDDPALPGGNNPRSLHAYVYPNLVSPSSTSGITLLGHHYGGFPARNRYWDFNTGTLRDTHTGGSVPATFLNIGGRCFIADGAREGFIADDRTAAIHTQKNQNLGIGTPTMPLTSGPRSVISPLPFYASATAYVHMGSQYINTPDPDSKIGEILSTDTVTPSKLGYFYGDNGGTLMAIASPSTDAVSSNTTAFTVTGTLSCLSGASKVTLGGGGTWPILSQYSGLAINFNGYSFVLGTTGPNAGAYDINGTAAPLAANEAYIMGVYNGPTVTNVPYTITGCQVTMPGFCTFYAGTVNYPAGVPGYSQQTSNLMTQIRVDAETGGGDIRNLGNISMSNANAILGGSNIWDGPTYAYAWYDPETGHMSNISPLSTVKRPSALVAPYVDYQNITPFFYIDIGSMSYPPGSVYPAGTAPTGDALRFSHIVFFRTLSTPGSSTLYPIGSLQPFVGKVHPGGASTQGSWNPFYKGWLGLPNAYTSAPPYTTPSWVWFDFSRDEDLLLAGGFRAPQYTNEKPMALLRGGATEAGKVAYQAYWDRRLWVVCTQEPDKVMFSCDEAQCPLGIPVESFPPTNYLRIPSVDGKVVGMKTFGEMLLITTERWAYTIAGNNESNYRLMRVSTHMGGVGTYQMSEMTSDVEGQSSIVYFLGRDKVVYEWIVGGAVNAISDPVQDLINARITTLATYQSARVHCVSAYARRLAVLTIQNGDATALVFDIANRVWTQNLVDQGIDGSGYQIYGQTPPAMTTVYGLDPPVEELYSVRTVTPGSITVRSWIRDDTSTQILNAFSGGKGVLETFPLNFDGLKTRKQLEAINIHVASATTGTYTVLVRTNESTSVSATMAAFPDNAYSIYGTPSFPVDSGQAKDLVVLSAGFTANNAALVGYRFVIRIETDCVDTPMEIYAIDIAYKDWEEAGEGDP